MKKNNKPFPVRITLLTIRTLLAWGVLNIIIPICILKFTSF